MKANSNLIITVECTHPLVFGKKTVAVFSDSPEKVTGYLGGNTAPIRLGIFKLSTQSQESLRKYHDHNPFPMALGGEMALFEELEGETRKEVKSFFSDLIETLNSYFQVYTQQKQQQYITPGMYQQSPFGTPNPEMYFNTLQQQIQMLMASVGSAMPPQPPFGNPSMPGFPNNNPQYFQEHDRYMHPNGVPSWGGVKPQPRSRPQPQPPTLTFATVVWKDEEGNYGQTIVDATGKNTEQLKEDFEKNFSMANSVTVATVVYHNRHVTGGFGNQ